jgi:hypothetical protein
MAQWLFRLLARDFYNSQDTLNIDAPDIRAVYYQDAGHNAIRIDYDVPVTWPDDTLSASMENYFYLDDAFGNVQRGYTTNDGYSVILELKQPSQATLLTYLPNATYNHLPTKAYEGPWIRGLRGVGALSFYHVPIGEPSGLMFQVPGTFRLRANFPNPFNMQTKIVFELPAAGDVEMNVFTANGQLVRRLVHGRMASGRHTILWNGKNAAGQVVASGAYFVQLRWNTRVVVRKMVLVK